VERVQYPEVQRRVIAARTVLLLDSRTCFFGSLSLRLRLVEDGSAETAWTDGVSIGYNPQYVDGLSQAELIGLVAHEVLHVSNLHPWRRGGREPVRFNEAADYAINSILRDSGFSLPEGALLDSEYTGKSAEWIFDRLGSQEPEAPEPEAEPEAEGEPEDGGEDGDGDGDGDEDGEPESGSEASEDGAEGEPESGSGEPDKPSQAGEVRDAPQDEGEPSAEDWKQAVREAAMVAGELGGELERNVERAVESHVDWRSILRRFVTETSKADYTWTRPNTSYVYGGMYLPSLRSQSMAPIVIAIDTSGSIDTVALGKFSAEIEDMISEVQPSKVHIFSVDTEVKSHETFEAGEALDFTPKGGGGTDFRPLFSAVEELEEPPCCVIYFTDLYGPFPSSEPEVPTLWACTSREVAPFGETVRLED